MTNYHELVSEIVPIGIRYRNTLFIPESGSNVNDGCEKKSTNELVEIFDFVANLLAIGFKIQPKECTAFIEERYSYDDLKGIYDAVAKYAGFDHPYHTFYNGAYADSIPTDRLYLNAIIHYMMPIVHGDIMDPHLMFDDPTNNALHLDPNVLSVIRALSDTNGVKHEGATTMLHITRTSLFLNDIVRGFLMSNAPLSDMQKDDLVKALQFIQYTNPKSINEAIPETVPCKETLALLLVKSLEYGWGVETRIQFNNPTDILRFYAKYSGSDESLSTAPRFKDRLNGKEKRMFRELLIKFPKEKLLQSFQRHPEYWKRAFERIKPEKYSNPRYAELNYAVRILRTNDKKHLPKTPNAICEYWLKLAKAGSLSTYEQGLSAMKQFPGLFIRYFDAYIRAYGSRLDDDPVENNHFQSVTLKTLHEVLPQVQSTSMLADVMTLYSNCITERVTTDKSKLRYVRNKSGNALISIAERDGSICNDAFVDDFLQKIFQEFLLELTRRFSSKEYLGNVYIDPIAADVVVPTKLRHASEGRVVLPSQSSFCLDNFVDMEKVDPLRNQIIYVPYIHWTNRENGRRVDIDLSSYFYDKDFNLISYCWYRDLVRRTQQNLIYATHSGDITDGGPYEGDGVSEFLLIRKDVAKLAGIRYVVVTCHDYTQYGFRNNPVQFGFQVMLEDMSKVSIESLNEHRVSGKLHPVIKPEQVLISSEFNSDDKSVLACIVDLEENKLIYGDVSMYYNLHDVENQPDLKDIINGKLSFVDYINNRGNNVQSTEASAMSTLRGLLDKPRLTCGQLMIMHASSRGNLVTDPEIADVILTLPNSKLENTIRRDQREITPFMTDVWLSEFLDIKK